MTGRILAAALACLVCLPMDAAAHPLSPSLLRVDLVDATRAVVVWRTPSQRMVGADVAIAWPAAGCVVETLTPTQPAGDAALETRFSLVCQAGLGGHHLGVRGLERAGTNAILEVRGHHLLTPSRPTILLASAWPAGPAARVVEYGAWGVSHFFGGLDHVLFLVALMVILTTGPRRHLFVAVGAFTLGHSVTLLLAMTQAVPWSPWVSETLIALTLVALGVEVLRRGQDPGPIARHPALVPLAFGLVHGLGFAGALTDLGVPTGDLGPALLGFNVGLEVAQLAVVAAVLLLAWSVRPGWSARLSTITRVASAYVVGTMGVYWTLERVVG